MGVVLLLLHLFWVRVAALIFMLMFGINFAPALEDLPMAMLRSPMLLPFLILGTAAGARAGRRSPSPSRRCRSRCWWTGRR